MTFKTSLLTIGLLAASIVSAFGAGLEPTAPVLLWSSPTEVMPSIGERVVMSAVWSQSPVRETVPLPIYPASFEIEMSGESYTLFVGSSEGSISRSTEADYGSADVSGRVPLWGDSRGNYGEAARLANAWTPTNTWDYAFTTGTSRTLLWSQKPATFFRFHFPDSVVALNGVVEQIDATGNVLAKGTYRALRLNSSSSLTELANVTWFKDGQKIIRHDTWSGRTPDWFDIPEYSEADGGTYTMHVESSKGSLDVNFTVGRRAIPAAPATGRLMNISARTFVGTGEQILIGGAVIGGGKAQILIRAGGPSLSGLGVTGVLEQPSLRVFKGSTAIGENTGWGTSPDAAQFSTLFAQLGAQPWATGSADSAILLTLDAGPYTFHVTGANGGTGVALLEIFLVTGTGLPGYLTNLSSRGVSGSGENVMITGFVAQGDTQVLVRGIGPTLTAAGVTGALASPQLELYSGGTKIDSVDAWSSTYSGYAMSNLFRKLGATALNAGTADTVDVIALNGSRTAQIKSTNGETGVALAEVYLVLP